uniref:Uncharacterized protein n=1 Tax=Timema bartmani TaxID=61472 RepID=A0A7R9I8J4_9NEOP|nr:unnamed protein product [Timema bartmani]
MSVVRNVLKRQEGFENITHYDHAVQRMKCYSYDEFTGLTTSTNEEQLEPNSPPSPVFAAKFCNLPGYQHFVALADEDGRVALQDTRPDVGFTTKTKGT